MAGLTRGAMTLIGVLVAGFLIWWAVSPLGDSASNSEFWWAVLMCALAGFVIALSQLLGGWTKWGWPRISGNVFLLGFLPALILGGWVLLFAQPDDGFLGDDVRSWSNDLGIDGAVEDLSAAALVIAFGLGLVLGLTLDTTGPRVRRAATPIAGGAVESDRRDDIDDNDRRDDIDEDDRRVHIREGGTPVAPQPEPPPRSGDSRDED